MNETKILERLLELTDITNQTKETIHTHIVAQRQINRTNMKQFMNVIRRQKTQKLLILGLCVAVGGFYYRIYKLEQEKK